MEIQTWPAADVDTEIAEVHPILLHVVRIGKVRRLYCLCFLRNIFNLIGSGQERPGPRAGAELLSLETSIPGLLRHQECLGS